MDRHSEDWTWHRWQLLQVGTETGGLVVDAIELEFGPDDPDDLDHQGGFGRLITLVFVDDDDGRSAQDLQARLRRWVEIDDGMCEAFHRPALPFGCLALFQGTDSVILAISSSDGEESEVF